MSLPAVGQVSFYSALTRNKSLLGFSHKSWPTFSFAAKHILHLLSLSQFHSFGISLVFFKGVLFFSSKVFFKCTYPITHMLGFASLFWAAAHIAPCEQNILFWEDENLNRRSHISLINEKSIYRPLGMLLVNELWRVSHKTHTCPHLIYNQCT